MAASKVNKTNPVVNQDTALWTNLDSWVFDNEFKNQADWSNTCYKNQKSEQVK